MRRTLITALVAFAATAAAAEEFAGKHLQWDNDLWAKGRTDRWYTNGLRFTWTYDSDPAMAFTRGLAEAGRWLLLEDQPPLSFNYSIGQSMYTPRVIQDPDPQPYDRPWGAFTYLGWSVHADGDGRFVATELKLGLTGRNALGEQTQKLVHHLVGSPQPQGWDQQVRSRPGVQLSHLRTWMPLAGDWAGLQGGFGVALGSLRDYASANLGLIVGDLKENPTPIVIGNEGDFVVQDFQNRALFEKLYGFIGASRTLVGYNYFLQGRTPYGGSRIDERGAYSMLQWGFSLPLHRWTGLSWMPRLAYMQTFRTPEFSSPTLGRDEGTQRWGTLAFYWDRHPARR